MASEATPFFERLMVYASLGAAGKTPAFSRRIAPAFAVKSSCPAIRFPSGKAAHGGMMYRHCLGLWAAAFAAAAALAAPASAQSHSAGQPARMASQAPVNDLQQRFAHVLVDEGRSLALGPNAGVDETRQVLLRRGAVYESMQEYAAAEASLTQAVQMSPPAAAADLARGYYYMRRGRFNDAL